VSTRRFVSTSAKNFLASSAVGGGASFAAALADADADDASALPDAAALATAGQLGAGVVDPPHAAIAAGAIESMRANKDTFLFVIGLIARFLPHDGARARGPLPHVTFLRASIGALLAAKCNDLRGTSTAAERRSQHACACVREQSKGAKP
jgi:hypothetical protein